LRITEKREDTLELERPVVTEYMLQKMRETGPWTRLISVMGFIGMGFMVLMGLMVMLGSSFIPQGEGAPPIALMGIFYILLSLVYLFPLLYLFRYSSAVKRLRENSQQAMEDALSYQKSFWKFVGILTIIGLIFAILGMIAAILIPVFLATKGMPM
jgi:magnesium-transporting ATPase (P-type)